MYFYFRCNCSTNTTGDLCLGCSSSHYINLRDDSCEPCNCGVGMANENCDSLGRCTCKLPGSGTRPYLAEDKCVSRNTPAVLYRDAQLPKH